MSIEITILGSSSATPTLERHPSAQYINMLDRHILVDCGEGTQVQLMRYKIRRSKIQYIFISHVHADHILGLPGLLFSMNLMHRAEPLHLFGPESIFEIIELYFKHSATQLRFEIIKHVTTNTKTEMIWEDAFIRVKSFPLFHRVPTTGFIFEEQPRLRKINKEACEKYHIPFTSFNDLKRGKDYVLPDGSKLIENQVLTFDPVQPVCYAYASDTLFDQRVASEVEGVDILYHESTFAHDMAERAAETMHSTALQAGLIAQAAEVNKLVIGHFSTRYDDLEVLLNEARSAFQKTELAIEGTKFVIE